MQSKIRGQRWEEANDRMKDVVLFVGQTPLILARAGMPNGAGCTDTICVTDVILEKYELEPEIQGNAFDATDWVSKKIFWSRCGNKIGDEDVNSEAVSARTKRTVIHYHRP